MQGGNLPDKIGMAEILIINDSPTVSAMLGYKLSSEGFSVDAVETGEEGVEKAKNGDYKLVLVDFTLPGIDGAEVCRLLRSMENTKTTPVVFISAKDEAELCEIVKSTGANGHMDVCFDGNEMTNMVKGFTGNRHNSNAGK
jgi:DNA-binding response OmpR family regulator